MKANWELTEHSYVTVVDNTDYSFIAGFKELPNGDTDFCMDVDVRDEEDLYVIIGMLKLFITKATFENDLDVDLSGWECEDE